MFSNLALDNHDAFGHQSARPQLAFYNAVDELLCNLGVLAPGQRPELGTFRVPGQRFGYV